MKITNKISNNYIKNNCKNCPKCNSDLIYAGEPEFTGPRLLRPVYCRECRFKWDEVFIIYEICNKENK